MKSPSRLALYLVCGVIVSVSAQYFFVQLDALLSGNVLLWTLGSEQLESSGAMRYVKDTYLLIFAVLWPWLIVTNSKQNIRLLMKIMFFEGSIIFLGLIGHMFDPHLKLVFAGIRWMLLLHAAIGVFFLIRSFDLYYSKDSKLLNNFIFIFVVVSSVWAIVQWIILGSPTMSAIRFSSMFSNAGVFGFAMVGAALFFVVSPNVTRSMRVIAVSFALAAAVLSGSRAAMMLIVLFLLLIVVSPSQHVKIKHDKILILVTMIFITLLLVIIVLPFVEGSAGRGSLIANQMDESGRVSNLIDLADTISLSPLVNIMFGKGFGYGTNNAYNFAPELIGTDPWFMLIDNTFATWYLQFGLIGLLLLLLVMVSLFLKMWKVSQSRTSLQFGFYAILLSIFTVIISGNMFESYHYLLFLFISGGLYFDGRKVRAEESISYGYK